MNIKKFSDFLVVAFLSLLFGFHLEAEYQPVPIRVQLQNIIHSNNLDLKRIIEIVKENSNIVFSRDGWGNTPLHDASLKGNIAVINLLIQHKADVAAKNNSDTTAIHLAAMNGHIDAINLLIQHGADITTENHEKKTPLQITLMRSKIRDFFLKKQDGNLPICN